MARPYPGGAFLLFDDDEGPPRAAAAGGRLGGYAYAAQAVRAVVMKRAYQSVLDGQEYRKAAAARQRALLLGRLAEYKRFEESRLRQLEAAAYSAVLAEV